MTITEKIKTIDNKIGQNKTQYSLERQTASISALSSGNVGKYEFLTGKYVLPEKDFQKTSKTKRFEYSLLGKQLKAQIEIAKDQCKFFKDQMNVNNNNKEEDMSDEYKSDESKNLKKFHAMLKDIKNIGRTTKPISIKSRGSNINLHPSITR